MNGGILALDCIGLTFQRLSNQNRNESAKLTTIQVVIGK